MVFETCVNTLLSQVQDATNATTACATIFSTSDICAAAVDADEDTEESQTLAESFMDTYDMIMDYANEHRMIIVWSVVGVVAFVAVLFALGFGRVVYKVLQCMFCCNLCRCCRKKKDDKGGGTFEGVEYSKLPMQGSPVMIIPVDLKAFQAMQAEKAAEKEKQPLTKTATTRTPKDTVVKVATASAPPADTESDDDDDDQRKKNTSM
jgi:hypothetical protein